MENWKYECKCGCNMVYKPNEWAEKQKHVNFICKECGYDVLTPFKNPYIDKGDN